MTQVIIDHLSTISVLVRLFSNGHSIGSATGFFWTNGSRTYLVSNWHVFSGRNTYTGQPIHKSGAIPDLLEVDYWVDNGGELKRRVARFENLNGDETVSWLQHPIRGQNFDIAALELLMQGMEVSCVALSNVNARAVIDVAVGNDCFIIGFPYGMTKQLNLPIWKRASVASEFLVPFDELPLFIVDSATREGMSGSPVYAVPFGPYRTTEGVTTIAVTPIGSRRMSQFLGVYSGRYGPQDEISAQLGRVWQASLIDDVIRGNKRGEYVLR